MNLSERLLSHHHHHYRLHYNFLLLLLLLLSHYSLIGSLPSGHLPDFDNYFAIFTKLSTLRLSNHRIPLSVYGISFSMLPRDCTFSICFTFPLLDIVWIHSIYFRRSSLIFSFFFLHNWFGYLACFLLDKIVHTYCPHYFPFCLITFLSKSVIRLHQSLHFRDRIVTSCRETVSIWIT